MALVGEATTAPQTRAAVEAAVRGELEALGARREAFRRAERAELERLGAFQWLTQLVGLRSSEVAERAGVSRQTLLNLDSADRGSDYQWSPDVRLLLTLGLDGPQGTDDLVGAIARPPVNEFQVTQALDRLLEAGLIAEAGRAAAGVGQPKTYWRLTSRGIDDLPRRLRDATIPPSQTWTAYIQSSSAEANAIVNAGEKALGEYGAALIPPGTLSGMNNPEVAFRVEAPDPHAAQTAAVARFAELRARAGMTPRQEPVIVAALIPPERPSNTDA